MLDRVHFKKWRFTINRLFFVVLSVSLSLALFSMLAFQPCLNAQTDLELATQYAPVLHFTSGETFYPTSVEYIIENSVIRQRRFDGTSSIIDSAPSPSNLGTYTSNDLFLDNRLETFEAIAAEYASNPASNSYFAYVRTVESGTTVVIQYWLFYIFNNGPMNDHQGDIEVIMVFLDDFGDPQTVLASQHGAGQNVAWNEIEKTGDHPVIYVAEGSHANYFRSYQGRMGLENDIVSSDGKTITPDQLNLIPLGSQSWLDFRGRWGYWGTEQEVALGRAGPLGPVYNQDGTRWSQPYTYLASTSHVDGTYFIMAWVVANLMLLFVIYIVAGSIWKIWGIFRLHRKGGLLVGKFLRGRGSIGLIISIIAIILTAVALFVPWYSITASSQTGPLAQEGGATLMTIDGITGVTVNLFLGPSNSDSTSGYVSLFSTIMPFAIIIAAGVILLTLDVIGVKSGKSLGKKIILSMISTLLPVILIIVLVSALSALVPFAAGLFPGQTIPSQVENMIIHISSNPFGGTTASQFPIVGSTHVYWGLGIGSYLFIVAAVMKVIGGFIVYSVPDLKNEAQMPQSIPPPIPPPMPPPPPNQ